MKINVRKVCSSKFLKMNIGLESPSWYTKIAFLFREERTIFFWKSNFLWRACKISLDHFRNTFGILKLKWSFQLKNSLQFQFVKLSTWFSKIKLQCNNKTTILLFKKVSHLKNVTGLNMPNPFNVEEW